MGAVTMDTKVVTPASTHLPTSTPTSYSGELAAFLPGFLRDAFNLSPNLHPQQPEPAVFTPAQVDIGGISPSLEPFTYSPGPIPPSVTKQCKGNKKTDETCKERNRRSAAAYRKRKRGNCNLTIASQHTYY